MSCVRSLMRSVLSLEEKRPSILVIGEDEYLAEHFSTLDANFYFFGRSPLNSPNFSLLQTGELPLSVELDAIITYAQPDALKFARFWHLPCIQIISRKDIGQLFGDLLVYQSESLQDFYQRPGLVVPPYIDENFLYMNHDFESKQPIILTDIESATQLEIAKQLVAQTRFKVQTVNKADKIKRLEQYKAALCFLSLNQIKCPVYGLEAAACGLPVICTPKDEDLKDRASFIGDNLNEIRFYISNLKENPNKKEVECSSKNELLNIIMNYSNNYVRMS